MGTLYIVPTPIGNLQDMTIRSLEVLFSVQYIACEDTRKTGQLLKLLEQFVLESDDAPHPDPLPLPLSSKRSPSQALSLMEREHGKPHLISYYEETEFEKIPGIINILQNGFDVALVSDAGMPGISDPGFRLINACQKEGVQVVVLPGASSVLTALVASGLPTDRFTFIGYPPHKPGHRKTLLENIKASSEVLSSTFIFFEAPHKLLKTLEEMQEVLGDIELVLCRELTKKHEETVKGKISVLIEGFSTHKKSLKGEFVIVFHL